MFTPVHVTAHNYIALLHGMVQQLGGSGSHGYAAQRARMLQNATKVHRDAGAIQLMVHQADAMVVDAARRGGWTHADFILWNNSGNGFEFSILMFKESPNTDRAAELLRLDAKDSRYASDSYRAEHATR